MMSNDLYDRLLNYIELQRTQISREMKREASLTKLEYLKGRYNAFLDLTAFLMTDGKLKQSTRTTRTKELLTSI